MMGCIGSHLPMILNTTPEAANFAGSVPWMAAGARYAGNLLCLILPQISLSLHQRNVHVEWY